MKIKDRLKIVLFLVLSIIIVGTIIFYTQNFWDRGIDTEEVIAIATDSNQENVDSETYQREIQTISSRSGERKEENIDNLLSSDIIEYTKSNTPTAVTIPMEQYIELSELRISMGMDLNKRTGLSKEDFKLLISRCKADSTKWFYNNSDLIYDLCKKYSINEIFFCGLISAESGWNIASSHRATNNFTSLMSGGKLIAYGSLAQGLETSAKVLHDKYLSPGGSFYHGSTIQGVARCYCPEGSWPSLVFGRMQQLVK